MWKKLNFIEANEASNHRFSWSKDKRDRSTKFILSEVEGVGMMLMRRSPRSWTLKRTQFAQEHRDYSHRAILIKMKSIHLILTHYYVR
jgi:hypothetical protein